MNEIVCRPHRRKYIVPRSKKFHSPVYPHPYHRFLSSRDERCRTMSNSIQTRNLLSMRSKKFRIFETSNFLPIPSMETHARSSREHFPENPLFARGDSFFAAIMSRFLGRFQRWVRQGWIFDRRAGPQWEICTGKRITDVFVRSVTMGSRLEPIP